MAVNDEDFGRDARSPVMPFLFPRLPYVSPCLSAESPRASASSRFLWRSEGSVTSLHSMEPLNRSVCPPGIRSPPNAEGGLSAFSTVSTLFSRPSFSLFRPPVLPLFPPSSGLALCSSEPANILPKESVSACPRANPGTCPVASPAATSGQGCPFGHGKSGHPMSDLLPSSPSFLSLEASSDTANVPPSASSAGCSVKHGSATSFSDSSAELPDECPMKRQPARKSFSFSSLFSSSPSKSSCPYGMGEGGEGTQGSNVEVPAGLSDVRERSTIPSASGQNWNYPSEKQFYRVTRAKGHQVDPGDMPAIVAIHNAVNEQTWVEILRFEALHQRECDTPKLLRFVGRPEDLTFKARVKHLLGYERPFDRHDWLIDRCGTKVRYLIDFYDGRATPEQEATGKVAIYIDARPDILSPHGLLDRVRMFFINKGWLQP
uniref:Holocytochrome c-type synthase n=1 Tax=Toxoplasma gondii TgCATBr9 TaxID=943120 RepID=A0A2T6J1S8_TOXGO|nr:hypothetical protein TGBR9_314038 [Toxoplasma gondii TgCATBr9]